MKKYLFSIIALCSLISTSAETITTHYYGSEIDLTQKNNPCKGNTDGGVEVIVVTNVTSVQDDPSKTLVERIYSLPNGDILKIDREIIEKPKAVVLHKLFPHEFTSILLDSHS